MMRGSQFSRRRARLRAYWKVLQMSAREDRANPIRVIASVALGIFRMVLFAAIYKVAYEAVSTTALPYENAVWSVGMYFALIIGLRIAHVFLLIDRDVRDGSVEVALVRPLDWRLVKIAEQIGKNYRDFFGLVVAFSIALTFLTGTPDMSYATPGFILGYLVIVGLYVITSSALFTTVGMTAFWLNNAAPVFRIIDKMILVVGGAFVPIALFPEIVQTVVRYSPFGVYAASTQLFNPGLATHIVPTLVASALWAVGIVLLCNWVWKRVERRIEVNGG